MRVGVDANVLVSAVISQAGPPRAIVSTAVAAEFIDGLAQDALLVDDPPAQPGLSIDPDDDYPIALARATAADYRVSGDRHLLDYSADAETSGRPTRAACCTFLVQSYACERPSISPTSCCGRHAGGRRKRERR